MKSKISKRIKQVLDKVCEHLPPENVKDAKELLAHNEWGESLLLICTQLYEYDIIVSSSILEEMKKLVSEMKLECKELNLIEVG